MCVCGGKGARERERRRRQCRWRHRGAAYTTPPPQKQETTNSKQQTTITTTTNNKQQTTNNKQQTTNNKQQQQQTHRVGRGGGERGAKVVGRAEVVGIEADGPRLEQGLGGGREGGCLVWFGWLADSLGSGECEFFFRERACVCVRVRARENTQGGGGGSRQRVRRGGRRHSLDCAAHPDADTRVAGVGAVGAHDPAEERVAVEADEQVLDRADRRQRPGRRRHELVVKHDAHADLFFWWGRGAFFCRGLERVQTRSRVVQTRSRVASRQQPQSRAHTHTSV